MNVDEYETRFYLNKSMDIPFSLFYSQLLDMFIVGSKELPVLIFQEEQWIR